MPNRISCSARLRFLLCLLLGLFLPAQTNAQSVPDPTREQLLNGLTVLFWQRPGDANVLLKLRIHSGAAFDLAGKGGTMALLDDALFPDPSTSQYVRDQLGGQFELTTNYDSIDVTLSGDAREFERMVELLRGALVTTQLTPENVTTIRDARLKRLRDLPVSATQIADDAIAARVFGSYPYGHPAGGTIETVSKVDRADLLFARERFLIADNASLVVAGGIEKARAMRALRQLLGPWLKGDRVVPSTFRQPNPPDARVLIVNQPETNSSEIRLAVRGLARSDRDASAAALLARIAHDRWLAIEPDMTSVSVRHEAHALPGIFILAATAPAASTARAISAAQQAIRSLVVNAATPTEVERARIAEMSEFSRRTSKTELIADGWLDRETFRLPPFDRQVDSVRSITNTDLQRVANLLFKDAAVATVVVGNYEQLKAIPGSTVELRTEKSGQKSDQKKAADSVTPAKKP